MDKHNRKSRHATDSSSSSQNLDADEREWSELIAEGKVNLADNADSRKHMKMLQQAAKNSRKKVPITMRLESLTLDLIKQKARSQGLPYQTMISSLLFKFARGDVIERK